LKTTHPLFGENRQGIFLCRGYRLRGFGKETTFVQLPEIEYRSNLFCELFVFWVFRFSRKTSNTLQTKFVYFRRLYLLTKLYL
jgi:hypothetical protein